MVNPRSPLRSIQPDRRGYDGLRLHLMYLEHEHGPLPRWLWRVYWYFQPIRCRLNFHNWYDTAAGLCSACLCGASTYHSNRIMRIYRWRPWMRDLATRLEEAEDRARFFEAERWRTIEQAAA